MEKLTKKYGLLTAICMVVGIVIGSGIFFKAPKVLGNTGGNLGGTLLVVASVGIIMIICSFVFATLSTKYEKVNGVVDYAEALCGKRFAYYVGWFLSTMYYPILTSTLAWVSARYTLTLFNLNSSIGGGLNIALALAYMLIAYAINALSPKIAGKFQVSATIIKLIPLVIMAIVGTIAGLINGLTIDAFTANVEGEGVNNNFFTAVTAFVFAYEGWIIATSINSELKNGKKNLYIALFFGALIVVGIYMLYFIGLSGVLTTEQMIAAGDDLPKVAFSKLFGSPVVGTLVMVFVIISCLGTMNGLLLGCCRGLYSLSARNEGPLPKLFGQIDKETNIPHNSSIIGIALCGLWLLQWQMCTIGEAGFTAFWNWEGDEVSCVTLYGLYIPIFIGMMIKCKDLNVFKRFIMPILATVCCGFMCFASYKAYSKDNQIWSYLLVFGIVLVIGFFFSNDFKKLIGKKGEKKEKAEALETE